MTSVSRFFLLPALCLLISVGALNQAQLAYAQSSTSTNTSNDTDDSNAFIIALAAVGLASLVAIIATQAAQEVATPSFGGTVAASAPICVAPAGVLVSIAGPRPLPLMYLTPGSFSYSYGPPVIPGQKTLGRAGVTPVTCNVPCPAGVCPVGFGFPILFNGSSLPSPV